LVAAAALARALATLADPVARDRICSGVTDRIGGYTYAAATAGLLSALASLTGHRPIGLSRNT